MEAIREVLSVLIVFLLLGAALWKLRRGPWNRTSKKGRSLEPVEKLALTPQHALHLIRVEGREILVATHPQGCTLIRHSPMERGAGA
jgi:flagellar biogenesis protein FliO